VRNKKKKDKKIKSKNKEGYVFYRRNKTIKNKTVKVKRAWRKSLTNNRSMKENQKVKMQRSKGEERCREQGRRQLVLFLEES
jgi:hypothetical protein